MKKVFFFEDFFSKTVSKSRETKMMVLIIFGYLHTLELVSTDMSRVRYTEKVFTTTSQSMCAMCTPFTSIPILVRQTSADVFFFILFSLIVCFLLLF